MTDERTRWFFDTEFLDDGRSTELISIALVPEDPALPEYYAESSEFDWSREAVSGWLRAHVEPHLTGAVRSRQMIADEVRGCLLSGNLKPEIWGYFPAYDWVVVCQLYGPMVALPEPFPHRPNDLAQLLSERGLPKKMFPDAPTTHNALDDARWIRDTYRAARQHLARVASQGRVL